MTLAAMLSTDRDALICDMAETYHIYDMRALPVETLATLACGLRDDSRIKLKMSDVRYIPPFISLIYIHDILTQVFHDTDSDAPVFRLADVMSGKTPDKAEPLGFDTPEEFEAERARYVRKNNV